MAFFGWGRVLMIIPCHKSICNNIGTFLVNSTYQYAILLANQFFDNLIIPTDIPSTVAKIIPKKATKPVFSKPTMPALK